MICDKCGKEAECTFIAYEERYLCKDCILRFCDDCSKEADNFVFYEDGRKQCYKCYEKRENS